MAFIGGIIKGAFNAVKSFATSGIGSMLIKTAATALGGPIGGAIASAATNLLSGKKLNLKSILSAGLQAFAPLAGGLVGNLVSKLPTALQAPLGNLASSLLSGKKPSLSEILKSAAGAFGQTSLGQKLTGIASKASELLGMGTKFGMNAQSALSSISNLLGKFGVNTSGLGNISNTIGNVLGAANKIQEILGQVGGLLNPQSDVQMLRA
jgi:hypothetical protein